MIIKAGERVWSTYFISDYLEANIEAFNEINNAASSHQNSFVRATIVEDNGTITRVQIDKSQFKLAPEITNVKGYINSEPITLATLKGKVVLVDFWTYSCINCIRTIPYLNAWYEKYSDEGLVIEGYTRQNLSLEKTITMSKLQLRNLASNIL